MPKQDNTIQQSNQSAADLDSYAAHIPANWTSWTDLPLTVQRALDELISRSFGKHPILDGDVHTDSAAQAVSGGSIIVANKTPKWDELTAGAAGEVLWINVDTPAWRAFVATDLAATAHRIFYSDAAGDVQELAHGAINRVLTSGGAAAAPTWEASAAGAIAEPFVTGVTGSGSITAEVYETDTDPANKVLESCTTDNDDIDVAFEITAGPDSWQPPSVSVTGGVGAIGVTKANLTQIGDTRRFSGTAASVQVTAGISPATILITTPDGAESDACTVTRALDPPLVTAAIFDTHAGTTGGDAKCDKLQNFAHGVDDALNDPDECRITGTTEAHATHVYVKDSGATDGAGVQGPFAVVAGAFDFTCDVGGNSAGAENSTLYAVNGLGTTAGADFNTTNTLPCSQTIPTFTGGDQSDIAYPGGPPQQEALKDAETCTVTITHTNAAGGDTYLYDDNATGELTIPNVAVYLAAKLLVARNGGDYREAGTNYRLTVTRPTQNGTIARETATVKIAHIVAVVTIAGATSRLGTDDGTNGWEDHTLTIQCDQANLSTYEASVLLTRDGGDTSAYTAGAAATGVGGWSISGSYNYTNTFRVEDADINTGGQAANNFTWGACSIKNRAAKETVAVTTNTTYQLGGFDERTLTIAAWPNREADIGVFVVATGSLSCENLSKGGAGPNGGTIFTFDNSPGDGNVPDNEVDKFCISDGGALVDDDNQYWYNKDQANAVSNSAGTAQVLIQESP